MRTHCFNNDKSEWKTMRLPTTSTLLLSAKVGRDGSGAGSEKVSEPVSVLQADSLPVSGSSEATTTEAPLHDGLSMAYMCGLIGTGYYQSAKRYHLL